MKINGYTAVAILLAAFAVLTGIKVAIGTVDATSLPPELKMIYDGINYICLTSAAAPLFVFIRNIYGFIENYLGSEQRSEVQYEARLLGETWIKYEEYIKAFTIMIIAVTEGTSLAPYAVYIAGSLAFMVDLIRKSLKDIAG
jgi:hypothetical protein